MECEQYQDLLAGYPECGILFGDGVFPDFLRLLRERGIRRIAVFTGRCSADANGICGRFDELVATQGVEVRRCRGIAAEPTLEAVDELVAFLAEHRPGLAVAFGGGSVLDAAKAAYLAWQAERPVADFFGSGRVGGLFPGRSFQRIIAFPTTAGTGSEATPYSNIVDPGRRVKKLIADPGIIPERAYVMPEVTASMPPAITMATGCDALAHLIEGFLNVGRDAAHPDANRWALAGIKLAAGNLERAIRCPDRQERCAMALAATLGGMVIRYKPTGLPHLASFSWFGRIPHGVAVAILLPAAWRWYLGNPAVAERTMELAEVFPGAGPEEVIASFRALLDRCGVPKSLKEFSGLDAELFAATALAAGENPMKLETAPRPLPVAEAPGVIAAILEKS